MKNASRSALFSAAAALCAAGWTLAAAAAFTLPPAAVAGLGLAQQEPQEKGRPDRDALREKMKEKRDEAREKIKEKRDAGGDDDGPDGEKGEKAGRHPILRKAGRDLAEAKAYLSKAPHDFGGHKAAAVRAIDEAMAQLKLAAEFDDAHTGPNENSKGKGAGGPAKKEKDEKEGKGEKGKGKDKAKPQGE